MALISIIMPAYNAAATLAACMDSILAQTYREIELIIVNDGSTDATASVLHAYSLKDTRVRAVHTENRGVSAARNTALTCARGDYIGFVDADDRLEPELFQRLYELITQEEADISVCGFWREYHDGRVEVSDRRQSPAVLTAGEAYAQVLDPEGFGGYLFNKLFRAEFFSAAGHGIRFDERVHICEDQLFVCECLCLMPRVAYDPVPLYHYAIYLTSASHAPFSARKATLVEARRRMADLTCRHFPALAREAEKQYITAVVFIFIVALHAGSDTKFLSEDLKRIKKNALPYALGKGVPFKNRLMVLALGVSPSLAKALYRLLHA